MISTNHHSSLCALGLMSGTSLDGIDIALITTDGEYISNLGPAMTVPYNEKTRRSLLAVLGKSKQLQKVETLITETHIDAINSFFDTTKLQIADIDVIGLHGQTIVHEPAINKTIQLGDAQKISSAFNIDVVADFRINDIQNGGEGAPLAPVFHRALAKELPHPVAILNIGGVANLTWIKKDSMVAFDTGPGNALIDDWVFSKTGEKMDRDGILAKSGSVSKTALLQLAANPFFSIAGPKSLDRNHFKTIANDVLSNLNLEDGAATLTAFTAHAVSLASKRLPAIPKTWLVSGGGRKNNTLMEFLRKTLSAPVRPVETVGWSGDALEAQLMGFLAVRSLYNLPLSFPETTGVEKPATGGRLFSPPLATP